MRRVVWTEAARTDLERIREYVTQFSPLAAQRMAVRLQAAGDGLAEFAERGRAATGGRREFVVIAPYLIRYRISGEVVFILRVRHGARRP